MDVFFYFIGSDRPPTTMRDTKSLPYPQGRLKNSPFLELTLFSVLFFKGMSKKVGKERERKNEVEDRVFDPLSRLRSSMDTISLRLLDRAAVKQLNCAWRIHLTESREMGKEKKTNNAAREKKRVMAPPSSDGLTDEPSSFFCYPTLAPGCYRSSIQRRRSRTATNVRRQ